MRLEHYPEEKLRREILDIVGRRIDLTQYRVFFFGSRVTNTGSERSDIDVGIEGPEPIPFAVMGDIEDAIEQLPTLYKIEIVDFGRVTPKFKQIATQRVERLNEYVKI